MHTPYRSRIRIKNRRRNSGAPFMPEAPRRIPELEDGKRAIVRDLLGMEDADELPNDQDLSVVDVASVLQEAKERLQ